MNVHKNAKLTPLGREQIVRRKAAGESRPVTPQPRSLLAIPAIAIPWRSALARV